MRVNAMNTSAHKPLVPYTSPACWKIEVLSDRNFLASGDYGGEGNPGPDLEPGDEYDF